MRAQLLAFTILAAAIAPNAFAQPAPAPMKTFMSDKEIMSLIDKANKESAERAAASGEEPQTLNDDEQPTAE